MYSEIIIGDVYRTLNYYDLKLVSYPTKAMMRFSETVMIPEKESITFIVCDIHYEPYKGAPKYSNLTAVKILVDNKICYVSYNIFKSLLKNNIVEHVA